jgi:hypothetical protein
VLYATDFGTSAVNAGWSWPSSVDSYRAFFCTYPTVLRTTRIASLIRKSISMNRTQLPPDYRVKKCSPEDMGRMGYPGCFSSVTWSRCGGSAGRRGRSRENHFFLGFEGLWREVVLDHDRRIERGEVDLLDLLIRSRLRLEDHSSLIRGLELPRCSLYSLHLVS